jgi:transcription-repair coupling factor (superfamily II helicase)
VNVAGLLAFLELLEPYRSLRDDQRGGEIPAPLGLLRAARPALLAKLARDLQRPIVVITGAVERAKSLTQSLRDWSSNPSEVLSFPEPLALFYERAPWTEETISGRLQVLSAFQFSPTAPLMLVTSARALMQRTLPPRQFQTSIREFHAGQTLDLERALGRWAGLGYEPVSVVEAPGQFSHRGGILDIFPPSDSLPVRSGRKALPSRQPVRHSRVTGRASPTGLPRSWPRICQPMCALS